MEPRQVNRRDLAVAGQEKRSLPRLELAFPVDLAHLEIMPMQATTAVIDDFSPQGVFVATDSKIPVGDRLELILNFPGPHQEKSQVKLTGEVMWAGQKIRQSDRAIVRGVGVKFVDLNAETFEQVLALYERLSASCN